MIEMEPAISQSSISRNKTRRHNRQRIVSEYIAAARIGHCADCHEYKTDLTFDHLDQATKLFNVGDAVGHGYTLSQVKREIEKCEMVCEKDHRKREELRHLPSVIIDKGYRKLIHRFYYAAERRRSIYIDGKYMRELKWAGLHIQS